jgi:hypothetical protein
MVRGEAQEPPPLDAEFEPPNEEGVLPLE